MPYFILKTLHILGVIVWLGGMTSILVFYGWLARKDDREGLRRMLDLGAQFGQKIIGPAVGISLLAAIAMIVFYEVGFPFWIWYGIAAMTASMTLGGGAIRKKTLRIVALLESGGDYRPDLTALSRLAVINLAILASAVAIMVMKPS